MVLAVIPGTEPPPAELPPAVVAVDPEELEGAVVLADLELLPHPVATRPTTANAAAPFQMARACCID